MNRGRTESPGFAHIPTRSLVLTCFLTVLAACGGATPPVQPPPISAGEEPSIESAPMPGVDRAGDIRDLSLGERHGCMVFGDGALRCFGSHDGRSRDAFVVERIALSDVHAVAAGGWFTCALHGRGQVSCWGNLPGVSETTPDAITLPGPATAIACGMSHACARLESGVVACWGSNGNGALGADERRPYDEPVIVPGIDDAQTVTAGHAHTCVRRAGGSVMCWGDASEGAFPAPSVVAPPVTLAVSDGVLSVAAGGHRTCVVVAGGELRCWGRQGLAGPVARGERIAFDRPVRGVALTRAHACAYLDDASLRCWGENEAGQLGDGSRVTRTPDAAARPDVPADLYAVGLSFTCAVRDDDQLFCWGSPIEGRMPASRYVRVEPRPVQGLGPVESVVADRGHTCTLGVDRIVRCFGDGFPRGEAHVVAGLEGSTRIATNGGELCGIVDGSVHCTRLAGTATASGTVVAGVSHAVDVVISDGVVCAVTDAGQASCWGEARPSLFGDRREDWEYTPRPRRVPGIQGIRKLVLEAGDACAVLADGRVRCWGRHREAGTHCGPGPTDATECDAFVSLAPALLDGPRDAVDVELHFGGGSVRCADGSAYWLALDPMPEDDDLDPRRSVMRWQRFVVGARASRIEWGGSDVGCALDPEGFVSCVPSASMPPRFDAAGRAVRVEGIPHARSVTVGTSHACAVVDDGGVHCWGSNLHGELGAAEPDPTVPAHVAFELP